MAVNPVQFFQNSQTLEPISGLLLVATATEEVAKRIESHLRNAGHPLRVSWVNDAASIEDELRNNPPDLMLCDRDVRAASRERVISMCHNLRPDLPVVLIGRQTGMPATIAALASGAADLASYEDLEHLQHLELVVAREISKHRNLRKLRQTQQQLEDFESRHRQLTESTGDAIGHVQEGILESANHAFAKLLGYTDCSELVGQPLIDLVDPSQQGQIKERLRAVLKGKHAGDALELKLVGNAGCIEVKAQLILGIQDGERVIELLIRAAAEPAAPAPAAAEAPAPAAPSRRGAFTVALSATPHDTSLVRSAILARIDDFAGLEERIGHSEADDIAAQAAHAIRDFLSPHDQLFTFSVDEVALLVQRENLGEIEQFSEQLAKEIRQKIFTASEHEAQVSLTIALFPLGATDVASAVVRQLAAEARRVSAKGGNQIVALGATAKAGLADREDARRAAQVKKALEENRLKLAYQCIASLEGETRGHFDILLRMLDESDREYHAAEFLPAAQKFDLMRPIDRWVTGMALDIIKRRTPNQDAAVLFVKLSEDTLRDSDNFIAWLKQTTQLRPMKADEIVFEIQELVLQNHIRKAKTLVEALTTMGAGVAVEHFGIGANSMQMLDHIPTGYLKFHPSFTQNFSDKMVQKKLTELVEAAKQRHIKTIVSHVEDANVMARLWQMGVNFIQGYHIQEPEVVQLSGDSRR